MPPKNTTPTAAKPSAKPTAAKPATVTQSPKLALVAAPKQATRQVIYPTITVNGIEVPNESMVIDQSAAKETLHWETEEDYAARVTAANPKVKPEQCKFRDPDGKEDAGKDAPAWTLIDREGNRVVCWNLGHNRPWDAARSDELAQVVLNKGWAGPSGCGETVNGEPLIIGQTGEVISGQHTLIGFVLACQDWKRHNNHWGALWPEEPVIEKLVVCGVAESQAILKTLDNVRARKAADTFYTSDLFASMTPAGKKECSRMLEAALKMLWRRLGCGESKWEHYQTIDASYNLLDRCGGQNGRLMKCIKHLYETNEDRQISNLKLSAGQCAAAMYLMASSGSDFDTYHAAEAPDEKLLDFGRWDKAEEFFTLLAAGADFESVRRGLGALYTDEGIGGRTVEKMAVLAKAWAAFAEDRDPTPEDCSLAENYDRDTQGNVTGLTSAPVFGGIDRGEKPEPKEGDEPAPTPEEVEAAKKDVRKKRTEEMKAVVGRAKGGTIPTGSQQIRDEIAAYKEKFPARPLIVKHGQLFRAWFEDADRIGKAIDKQCLKHPDGLRLQLSQDEVEECVAALRAKKINVAVCDADGNELFPVLPTANGAKAMRKPPVAAAPKANGKGAMAIATARAKATVASQATRKPVAKK